MVSITFAKQTLLNEFEKNFYLQISFSQGVPLGTALGPLLILCVKNIAPQDSFSRFADDNTADT